MKISKVIGFCYSNIWIRNIIFACLIFVVVFLPSLFEKPKPHTKELSILIILLYFSANYILLFIHNHLLFRLFLQKKKYIFYLLLLLSHLLLFTSLANLMRIASGRPVTLISDILLGLIITIIGLSVYIVNHWLIKSLNKRKIELLQKNNELNFLQQQISPHFLFNAINNLYGVALTSPLIISDKLLELSELLRYQIESIKTELVYINDELKFVEKYFNYANDRIHNIKIINEIEGSYSTKKIPPLLFLPLIENAIKYSSETDKPLIMCNWHFENDMLIFTIANNFLLNNSKIIGTKTGVENLKNRLNLLRIKHDLKITVENQTYKTELIIWNLINV